MMVSYGMYIIYTYMSTVYIRTLMLKIEGVQGWDEGRWGSHKQESLYKGSLVLHNAPWVRKYDNTGRNTEPAKTSSGTRGSRVNPKP